jgi:hypothetical protein
MSKDNTSNTSNYQKLEALAEYFFELDISHVVDSIIHFFFGIIQSCISYLTRMIHHLNLTSYIDTEVATDLHPTSDLNYLRDNGMYSTLRHWLNSIPAFVTSYSFFIPLLFEIWNMFYSTPIIRIWILGSFGITFICIWAIVSDRRDVSHTVCKVIGWDESIFDLDSFLRVGGFVTICIGLLLFSWSLLSLNIIECMIGLSVSNRIYRNIRSYLTISGIEGVER